MCQHNHHNTISASQIASGSITADKIIAGSKTWEEVLGRPLTRRERLQLWCARHPKVEVIICVVLALLIQNAACMFADFFHK